MARAERMTRSIPQRDTHQMIIPEGTIKQEPRRAIRFPLVWLRTWLFGLLAIVTLPVGAMFILVSQAQDGAISDAWEQRTATVTSVDDNSVRYSIDLDGRSVSGTSYALTDYQQYFTAKVDGLITMQISVCDIFAPVLYPRERGAEFNVWVSPNGSFVSCFPVTADTPLILNFIGWALVIVSAWILITTIGRSANHRVMRRNMQKK